MKHTKKRPTGSPVTVSTTSSAEATLMLSQDKTGWEITVVTALSRTVITCPRRGSTANVTRAPFTEVQLKARSLGLSTTTAELFNTSVPRTATPDDPPGVAAPDSKTAEMAMGNDEEWS